MQIAANNIYNIDCMLGLADLPSEFADLTLTDIPYDAVNRKSNGLRNLDKMDADIMTFGLVEFLQHLERVTKNTIIVFCGKEQFSEIYRFFSGKKGTTRPIVWEKTNPSPMNGEYIYLSGIEFAVWFKKQGAKTFNAHCKNPVFRYPNGTSKLHPTEKNHALLKDLILDNSNDGDLVLDPCCGSGSHLLVAKLLGRNYLGLELKAEYAKIAQNRIDNMLF